MKSTLTPFINKDPDTDYDITEDYPDKIMPLKTRKKSLLKLLKEAMKPYQKRGKNKK